MEELDLDLTKTSHLLSIVGNVKFVNDVKVRCYYDQINVTELVHEFLVQYVETNSDVMKIVNKIKSRKRIQNKKIRTKNLEFVQRGEKLSDNLNLSEKELENIYDVIESEDVEWDD